MKIRIKMRDLQSNTRAIAPDVHHSAYKSIDGEGGDYDERYVRIDRFDTVIVEGFARFTRGFEGWVSKVYENPTVADALMAMQTSMTETQDMHHAFFEGISKAKKITEGPCKTCGHDNDREIFEIAIYTGS